MIRMNIDIESGDKKVVASGVFVADSDINKISFNIGERKFNFTFLFKQQKDMKEELIKWYPEPDNDGLIIEFLNFDGILSSASPKSYLLASFEEYDLYLRGQINAFLRINEIADNGGKVKLIIRCGSVKVNGKTETRNKRKLHAGDIVEYLGKKYEVEEKYIR